MLVSFSGIDCAGKSTQIGLLEKALQAQGLRTVTIWHRPGYSREMNALRRLAREFAPSKLPQTEAREARDRVFLRPGVSKTWVQMALVDTIWQYGVKVRCARLAGCIVIADRYLDDGLFDLAFRFPRLEIRRKALCRLLLASSPKPDRAFLLMLPKNVMLDRMAAKDEPFPDTESIRDLRYAGYQSLAASGRYDVLDADQPAAALHREILARLP